MDQEKEKLVEILKRAKKNKISLKNLKIPKAYKKQFVICFRWKFFIVAGILSIIYGKYSYLLDTKKV
jgi:hypothetical protein